jgi:hypothetical protein
MSYDVDWVHGEHVDTVKRHSCKSCLDFLKFGRCLSRESNQGELSRFGRLFTWTRDCFSSVHACMIVFNNAKDPFGYRYSCKKKSGIDISSCPIWLFGWSWNCNLKTKFSLVFAKLVQPVPSFQGHSLQICWKLSVHISSLGFHKPIQCPTK